jgi:hypothetical protein
MKEEGTYFRTYQQHCIIKGGSDQEQKYNNDHEGGRTRHPSALFSQPEIPFPPQDIESNSPHQSWKKYIQLPNDEKSQKGNHQKQDNLSDPVVELGHEF